MEQKRRRRSYIVNKNFQLKYISIMVFLLLAATLLVAINIYYQMGRLIMENSQVTGIVSFLKSVNTTLIVWVLFIILLIIFLGLFISHRIAGPLKRLEDSMMRIGKGDFTRYTKIRKSDEFHQLVDVFNNMSVSLRQLILKNKNMAVEINKKIEYISHQLKKTDITKQDIDNIKDELQNLHSKAEELITEFKI